MSDTLSGYSAFPGFTSQVEGWIDDAAQQYGISPDFLANDLATESSFNPSAVNSESGASGIAQFIPSTADMMGVDPMDEQSSI